jgi:Yip1 domain
MMQTTIGSSRPAWRTWAERIVGAVVLDRRAYAGAADDPLAVPIGALIVLIAGLSQGLGTGGGRIGLVLGAGMVLVGWPLWATMIQVATGQRNTWTRLLRVLGLAHLPAFLSAAAVYSGSARLVVWAWSLAAAVVGVREALRCGTRKAALVTVLTWIALMVAATWIGRMFGEAMALRELMQDY